MRVHLQGIGKKFFQRWVIQNLSADFTSGVYAITGFNGSGKSTLAKLISGYLAPTTGTITYYISNQAIPIDNLYRYIAYCAPYIDLPEELTLKECWTFHTHFRPLSNHYSFVEFLDKAKLIGHENKLVKYFSSGMKQRLKLGLSLYTDSRLLILDEPTANLDRQGIQWYQDEIQRLKEDHKTILIYSNIEEEYMFCTNHIVKLDTNPI